MLEKINPLNNSTQKVIRGIYCLQCEQRPRLKIKEKMGIWSNKVKGNSQVSHFEKLLAKDLLWFRSTITSAWDPKIDPIKKFNSKFIIKPPIIITKFMNIFLVNIDA